MFCIIYFIPMKFTDDQHRFMAAAMKLANEAKGTTFPNPAVGAVVVANGRIVGSGATSPYGGPHAEKIALSQAGVRARNASLYVTLEPCCHYGKTPPCTDAIIASRIGSVFISRLDPNPVVCGRGIRQLKKNGIKVHMGLLSDEATSVNEDFFWAITRRIPWVTLKLALTLDGRIADQEGRSRWITSQRSRDFVHELRRRHAAIIVGRTTLLRDNPRLSARYGGRRDQPARIVFSSRPSLPATSYFIQHARSTRSIVVTAGGRRASIEKRAQGIELWHTGGATGEIDLAAFLHLAYNEGLTSLLVEGGGKVASSFMEHRHVNRVWLFYGNKLLGKGVEGFSFYRGLPLDRAITLTDRKLMTFGDDVAISGVPLWQKTGEK
jgi:diaminohydroxyphosphoribosylaminopyrimidine deaminase / 5-amino-6-(5-phosphoribosylamino)uracil reductase